MKPKERSNQTNKNEVERMFLTAMGQFVFQNEIDIVQLILTNIYAVKV